MPHAVICSCQIQNHYFRWSPQCHTLSYAAVRSRTTTSGGAPSATHCHMQLSDPEPLLQVEPTVPHTVICSCQIQNHYFRWSPQCHTLSYAAVRSRTTTSGGAHSATRCHMQLSDPEPLLQVEPTVPHAVICSCQIQNHYFRWSPQCHTLSYAAVRSRTTTSGGAHSATRCHMQLSDPEPLLQVEPTVPHAVICSCQIQNHYFRWSPQCHTLSYAAVRSRTTTPALSLQVLKAVFDVLC